MSKGREKEEEDTTNEKVDGCVAAGEEGKGEREEDNNNNNSYPHALPGGSFFARLTLILPEFGQDAA